MPGKKTCLLTVVIALMAGCESANSARAIEPRADQTLRAMCAAVGAAKTMQFRVDAQVDEASASGKMVPVSRQTQVLLRRPDGVVAQMRGGDGRWSLCYKAGAIAILREDRGKYATMQAPPTIDKMLDFLFEEHGLSIPLADLLFSDPYQALTENVQTGVYLGVRSVGGRPCHHLLFTQKAVDWQVWIDTGETPLPRKLVITHKNEPGQPQYSAELSDWNLAPAVTETSFDFKAPAGAKAVKMSDLRDEKGK
jgi:hypothetical protein